MFAAGGKKPPQAKARIKLAPHRRFYSSFIRLREQLST
jgi:hypothetical protein